MLSIIVVIYKSFDLTVGFVQRQLSKIQQPHRVVIVNNCATIEESTTLADALNAVVITDISADCDLSSSVFVLHSDQNLGFAKGNNLGAEFSTRRLGARLLLFSNNDIVIKDQQVVERLIDKFAELPQAGIIGPKIVGLNGDCQSPEPYMSFWDRHVWMYLCTPFYSKKKKAERFAFDYPQQAQEGYHYKLMGSFFMVRAVDFERCGKMDENTFLYAEEMILSERMQAIGLSPYYYPEVSVIHAHGATTNQHYSSVEQKKCRFDSECYYYRRYKHTPRWQILIGRWVNYIESRL